MRLSKATVVAALMLTVWFALDFVGVANLVDREGLVSLAGLMLLLMAGFLAAGMARWRFAAPVYAVALAVWGGLQIETHWLTWVTSAGEARLLWYDRAFGDHWRILPESAGHTVPDAYHTVLAVLLAANLILALSDTFRRGSPRPQGERIDPI
jgi:hypothetical protein